MTRHWTCQRAPSVIKTQKALGSTIGIGEPSATTGRSLSPLTRISAPSAKALTNTTSSSESRRRSGVGPEGGGHDLEAVEDGLDGIKRRGGKPELFGRDTAQLDDNHRGEDEFVVRKDGSK